VVDKVWTLFSSKVIYDLRLRIGLSQLLVLLYKSKVPVACFCPTRPADWADGYNSTLQFMILPIVEVGSERYRKNGKLSLCCTRQPRCLHLLPHLLPCWIHSKAINSVMGLTRPRFSLNNLKLYWVKVDL
jgi:hypothetical protein